MAELHAQLYTDAADFLRHAEPFLLASEAQYSLMLGVVLRLRDQEGVGEKAGDAAGEAKSEYVLATVTRSDGQVVAAAMRTPPHKIIVTEAPGDALDVLLDAVWTARMRPPAVGGPPDASRGFAERYVNRAGGSLRPGLRMRIHRLTAVQSVPYVAGSLRPANTDDADLLIGWADNFAEDAGVDIHTPGAQSVPPAIAAGRLFVWDDGDPVSMAAWSRPTPNSVSINLVYTPPPLRRSGYATACVAALSKHLLAEGRSMLCLYTDLSNPTSNAIYERIGYEPVSDWHDWWFEPSGRVTARGSRSGGGFDVR